jgi:hypothetical protein
VRGRSSVAIFRSRVIRRCHNRGLACRDAQACDDGGMGQSWRRPSAIASSSFARTRASAVVRGHVARGRYADLRARRHGARRADDGPVLWAEHGHAGGSEEAGRRMPPRYASRRTPELETKSAAHIVDALEGPVPLPSALGFPFDAGWSCALRVAGCSAAGSQRSRRSAARECMPGLARRQGSAPRCTTLHRGSSPSATARWRASSRPRMRGTRAAAATVA